MCWDFKNYCFKSFQRDVSTDKLRNLKILFIADEHEEATICEDYEKVANSFCWRKYFIFPKCFDDQEEYARKMGYNVNKFMFLKCLGHYICFCQELKFNFYLAIPNFIEKLNQSIRMDFFNTYDCNGEKCLAFKFENEEISLSLGPFQPEIFCFFIQKKQLFSSDSFSENSVKSFDIFGNNSIGDAFNNWTYCDVGKSFSVRKKAKDPIFEATFNKSTSFTENIRKAIEEFSQEDSLKYHNITNRMIKEKKEYCKENGYNFNPFIFAWVLAVGICFLDPSELEFSFEIDIPDLKENANGIVKIFQTYNCWGERSISFKIE